MNIKMEKTEIDSKEKASRSFPLSSEVIQTLFPIEEKYSDDRMYGR